MTEHVKKRLRQQRPDRVIGLRPTGTLRHHISSLRARCCPFKKANVVYPFIVIEAKAAENSNFPAMLRQTAFVMRTCLRLQQNLRRETRMPHQCLVWSFLILGEEWRLYAAVPDGLGVVSTGNHSLKCVHAALTLKQQIFDLWHGTVLFPEGALQLLLIIEYLCDWGCEVYRTSVLTCLAGGRDSFLSSRLSPSGTDISSQLSETGLTSSRAMSLPSRASLTRELLNGDAIGTPIETSPNPLEIEPLLQIDDATLLDGQDVHHWRRWVANEQESGSWVSKATIRHSNQVELSFLQMTMPAEVDLLRVFLTSWFPALTLKEAARKLLTSLQDDNLAVTASVKATSWQENQVNRFTLEVRALVYFRSALKPENWEIARHVLAILCDPKALKGLCEIAELNPNDQPTSDRCVDADCEPFKQAINWVKAVGGTTSAGLALRRRQLYLRSVSNNDGSSKFEWMISRPEQEGGVLEHLLERISQTSESCEEGVPEILTPYIKRFRRTYIVPQGRDEQGPPATALKIPDLRTSGALIKKPTTGWPEDTQDFCFLITNDNVRFDDIAKLGQLLEDTRRAKELYVIVRKKATYHQGDLALIDWWIRVLKNQSPYDTFFE